ncbi:hypothetical protein [Dyella sp.]|uniref:hypothetical protein n=1 Tax=Dyella sp. TaxID=1869338 RepID=UPI002B4699BF|nr:hypothetical protein [Dyella sp.]
MSKHAEQASSRLTVIPAKAGIQFQYVVRSTQKFAVSFGRIFELDSGFRRNDEIKVHCGTWTGMKSSIATRIKAGIASQPTTSPCGHSGENRNDRMAEQAGLDQNVTRNVSA